MTVNKDYENLLLKSWDYPEEQVRHTIYLNRKVNMEHKPRYHTQENHEYMEALLGKGNCIYCKEGCVIATKEEVNSEL
jgi:hypothetical protein